MFDNELLQRLWREMQTVNGLSPDCYRLDPCGALIEWSKYGDPEDENGWVIDRVFPISRIKKNLDDADNPRNLRPMHFKNNIAKGDSYPVYNSIVRYINGKNVELDGLYEVNEDLKTVLDNLYQE